MEGNSAPDLYPICSEVFVIDIGALRQMADQTMSCTQLLAISHLFRIYDSSGWPHFFFFFLEAISYVELTLCALSAGDKVK